MFRLSFLLTCLLLASNIYGADLNNLDMMEAKGFGCTQYINLVGAIAEGRTFKDNTLRLDLQRVEAAREMNNSTKSYIERSHPGFYDDLYTHLKELIIDIWKKSDIPPSTFVRYARANCEIFRGETSQFLTFEQWLSMSDSYAVSIKGN